MVDLTISHDLKQKEYYINPHNKCVGFKIFKYTAKLSRNFYNIIIFIK